MTRKYISLTNPQKEELKRARRKFRNAVSERTQYVLKLSEKISMAEIARQFGRNRHTVEQWVARYIKYGIDGLLSKQPPGRPNNKGCQLLEELPKILRQSPREHSYQHSGWQVNLLIDYFATRHNLNVGQTTMKRALKKGGWVYKRFAKTVPINAPSKQDKKKAIKKMVSDINSERANHNTELLFLDESHFSNEPYVARGWFCKGQKKRYQQQTKGKA